MVGWRRSRRAQRPARSVSYGFDGAAFERLALRLDHAVSTARVRGCGVVAAVTVDLPAGVDPLAHVAASGVAGEPWSCFSQPARDDHSIATVGASAVVTADGADRFDQIAAGCASVLEAAQLDDLFDDPRCPAGSGVVWVGGFGFLDSNPTADVWRDLPAARFVLPEVAIVRRGGGDPQARMTVAVQVQPDSIVADELSRIERRIDSLRLDDDLGPVDFVERDGPVTVASVQPPAHYEGAVAEAARQIDLGIYSKIVLAREVTLRRESPIDPVNAVRGLAQSFPECTVFAIGQGETTLIGASPELLIRREGRRASTIALAGSVRRGGDPETDAHLATQLLTSAKNRAEHEIVVKRIERTLGHFSAWVAAGSAPEVIKVKNIQHLATPIRAQLTEPRPVIELAGALHPTPAVGGEPWSAAKERLAPLEGFDRGWYTGAVGWTDRLEDGELHVALRSALIDGAQARLFAGCGIVAASDPAAELAETETKLQALLPVLSVC